MEIVRVQRRTLSLLFLTQIIGGVGVAVGIAVGALLTARMAGDGFSGLSGAAAVVGGALIAIPVTRLMQRRGRRAGLMLAYLLGSIGGLVIVAAAVLDNVPLLFAGTFLFGGGTAANLQARYAAVDLADPVRRGRHLSLVVWATTLGAVVGPNLARPADAALSAFHLPEYAGPFAFSALAFTLAAVVLYLLLRPDPLLLARTLPSPSQRSSPSGPLPPGAQPPPEAPPSPNAPPSPSAPASAGGAPPPRLGVAPLASPDGMSESPPVAAGEGQVPANRMGMRAALAEVARLPGARLGISAVAVGHVVMVGVMSMTPVHIRHNAADPGIVLRLVGIVLSVHIAGMYALSPLVGWATDRYGRRPVIIAAIGVLVAACTVAGTAGHGTGQLAAGLALLGLGWSGTMVAGSTLLVESVPADRRPAVQGLSDLVMGLAGATSGALSGVVVGLGSYPLLAVLAALCTVPLLGLALRPVRSPVPAGAD